MDHGSIRLLFAPGMKPFGLKVFIPRMFQSHLSVFPPREFSSIFPAPPALHVCAPRRFALFDKQKTKPVPVPN